MRHLTADNLPEVLQILRDGGVIVYPTETSYGLGCDATNHAAVERLCAMKGGTGRKAVSVILPSFDDAVKYVYLRSYSKRLAAHYWPGPVTLAAVMKPDSVLSPRCVYNNRHAVRVSSHPIAAALAAGLGKPIVATSANISGQPDTYRSADIFTIYGGRSDGPDAFLDVGDLPVVPPSTIVQVGLEGINVLRQGGIVVREVW